MATKTLIVSDLSGLDIPEEDHVSVIIDGKRLDLSVDEAATLESQKLDLVTVEIRGHQRRTVMMERSTLAKWFGSRDLQAVLEDAPDADPSGPRGVRPAAKPTKPSSGKDYSSANAGEPHRGRVTEIEKEYVRTNLDAVNARLARDMFRTIDPANAEHKDKYGF